MSVEKFNSAAGRVENTSEYKEWLSFEPQFTSRLERVADITKLVKLLEATAEYGPNDGLIYGPDMHAENAGRMANLVQNYAAAYRSGNEQVMYTLKDEGWTQQVWEKMQALLKAEGQKKAA